MDTNEFPWSAKKLEYVLMVGLAIICDMGLEGIVLKGCDRAYAPAGARTGVKSRP
jgi:hypothetical protein